MCLAGAFNAPAYEWITREERQANDVLDEAGHARTRPACGVALAAGQEPAVRRLGTYAASHIQKLADRGDERL